MRVAVITQRMLFVSVLTLVALAGCGGAESRKAKHLDKGAAFLAEGNFDKARVEFRNALQIAPNDSKIRYENGVADERLGNPREAAQFYQGAIDVDANNTTARAALGRLYLFSGAPDQALEIIKPSLTTHPMDPDLLTVRAAARVQLRDPDGARQDGELAVKIAPTNENAVAVLAGVYKSQNELEKARVLLEDAVKRLPESVDLRLALAQVYSTLGQDAQVEALLIDLTHIKPNEKAHRLRLAQYYEQTNHDDEAERVLRDAVKSIPASRELKFALIDFLATRRGRGVAEKELDAMILGSPKDFELKLAQATFYEQGKDTAKAESIYTRIMADAGSAPAANTARVRLAALDIQRDDTAAAERLLAQVLSTSPRDNDALILRGNIELAHQNPKAAIADLRAVLRDQPNAIGVMRVLARAHLANGEPALAEETMRRAVDINPKDAGARLDLAQLLAQMGKAEQAKPVLDELVKQQPNNVAALDAEFRVSVATHDVAGAKSAADAVVALQPKVAIGYFYQGAAAELAKRVDDAVRLYSVAITMQPDATEPLQALALLLVKQNRTAEALKHLDDTSARVPRMPTAFNIKGDILLSTQRPGDAAAAFQAAIERDPTWWVPYRGLAHAQSAAHDDPGAVSTLLSGIGKAADAQFLQIDLARMYETMDKPDAAIQLYEATLRKNPSADVAANNLAMILITSRKDQPSLDRAKELSQRFSSSTNPAFLDTYGWVLQKRGESAAAVAILQHALTQAPQSPVFLYHLGMAQASVGLADEARSNLSRSLTSGQTFSGMEEAKATLAKLAKLSSANPSPKT